MRLFFHALLLSFCFSFLYAVGVQLPEYDRPNAHPTLHWRGLKEREYLKSGPQNSRRLKHYRIRLNHHTESKPAISAIKAAAAEKKAVISVSRVTNTRRLLRVS